MTTTWWISFAHEDRPSRLAVIRTEATDVMGAVVETIRRGCNPGSDYHVLAVRVPANAVPIPSEWLDRLLTREEAERLDELMCAAEQARAVAESGRLN